MELHIKVESDFKDILKFLKDHSDRYFNIECCAFVGLRNGVYISQILANRSPEPNSFFCVDPLDFLKFKSENELLFIVHSHPHTSADFSEMDKSNAEACCLLSLVYSVVDNKFALYEPQNHEIDVNILNKVKGYL